MKPKVFIGGAFEDERGRLEFVNDFDLRDVKRFYTVSNKNTGRVRGWHGHKNEGKYVGILRGKAVLGAVEIDDWEKPSVDLKVETFTLDEANPSIVFIPPGFANAFKSETPDAKVIFYSTSTLEDSKQDDIRFPEDYWKL